MSDHLSYNGFACRTPQSRHGFVSPAPHVPHGRVQARRTGPGGGLRPAHSMCAERHPIPHGSFDEYLGGRSDRLGLELLFDLRHPVLAQRPMASALSPAAPYAIGDVLIQVRRRRPHLVWLYPGDPTRAEEIALRIVDIGDETILIDADEDDVLCADSGWI